MQTPVPTSRLLRLSNSSEEVKASRFLAGYNDEKQLAFFPYNSRLANRIVPPAQVAGVILSIEGN
jgi:hypothetical protein